MLLRLGQKFHATSIQLPSYKPQWLVFVLSRLGQCFMQPAQNQLPAPSSTPLTAGPTTAGFRKPLLTASSVQNKAPTTADRSVKQQVVKPVWLHNPRAEGAVVLNQAQWQQAGGAGGVWPVVVDPHVGRHLRPHQRQGVQFLYECIMGLRETNRQDPGRLLAWIILLLGLGRIITSSPPAAAKSPDTAVTNTRSCAQTTSMHALIRCIAEVIRGKNGWCVSQKRGTLLIMASLQGTI